MSFIEVLFATMAKTATVNHTDGLEVQGKIRNAKPTTHYRVAHISVWVAGGGGTAGGQ